MNTTSNPEDSGLIPGPTPWTTNLVAMSCGVGCRHGSDPVLLRLWWRPAATAVIGPQPGNFHVPWAWPPKKDKKKKCEHHSRSIIRFILFGILRDTWEKMTARQTLF